MSDSEEKKRRKQEKGERLRKKQEEHLKKAHDEEEKSTKQNAEAKLKEDIPEEMTSKGYQITNDEISSGQFSTLFKAKYKGEDIIVRIIEKEGKEEKFLKKLIPRFVIILRVLDDRHPNIISTLDVFETTKRVLALMRLAPNGTLYDYIDKQSDPCDESQCRKWAQQLISALCYLHINGIVHKDLRTERILLDENNSLKISGFTYSRLWMDVQKNTIDLSNVSVGTGPYCSPETLSGESYDPRTADVWAFGVIVFFIWNKSYPFDYNMTHKLLAQQKDSEWKNRIREGSNEQFKEFFSKTFDINHNQRPTIVDLIKDKWIDSKITVVLDEESKTLNENKDGKEVTLNEKTKDSKVKNENTEAKGKSDGSKVKDQSSNKQKETEDGNDSIKAVQNSDKKDENTNIKNKNETNKKIEDSDNFVEDDDDDDESEDSEPKSDQNSRDETEKQKPKEISEENPQKVIISPKRVKQETIVGNVLRPDILDELKKEFLSLSK